MGLGPWRTAVVVMAGTVLGLTGCDGNSTAPDDLRFGQVGQIQVRVTSPVLGGVGGLEETLVWRSDGPWVLAERLGYGDELGSETVRRPDLNPGDLAAEYGSLVQQLTETPGLRLFGPETPQDLVPTCLPERTRIEVVIRDGPRNEEARWVRCADGTLFTATPGSAGPDPGASRVVTAAQLARSFTLGDAGRSSYFGSIPFRSVGRGGDSPARLEVPEAFLGEGPDAPTDWLAFWERHGGSGPPPPEVDWEREMVLVATAGRRTEAGDSLQITRILPIGEGTRVEMILRVPGNFCSPAGRVGWPYHIVIAPRTPSPVTFADPQVIRVPCGGSGG
ncbi:MAG: hypothetical protein EA422_09420 [Gemmatimonadales bacterium]|nr:MAG: hypothetical protein EA422_09420 [Gemmatimonadales bacterium]